MDEYGIYCKECVDANVRNHVCEQSDADLLVPYTGTGLCAECGIRPATLQEPDSDTEE